MGSVALLSVVIYGCGEKTLPPPTEKATTTVSIVGSAV
jgi:hypothetical protein